MSAVSMLYARQTHGNAVFTSRQGTRRTDPVDLASHLGWNPKRLQNMSLIVGPGTPASALMFVGGNVSEDEDSSSSMGDFHGHPLWDNDDDDSSSVSSYHIHPDQEMEQQQQPEVQDEDQNDEDAMSQDEPNQHEDSNNENDTSDRDTRVSRDRSVRIGIRQEAYRMLRRRLQEQAEAAAEDVAADSTSQEQHGVSNMEKLRRRLRERQVRPSMRHGGCINTACWLDCPWRLSCIDEKTGILRSDTRPMDSQECPTQLATSGDDRLLKFWDVSGAMGTDNPIHGGWNTFSPFCTMQRPDDKEFVQTWKDYYSRRLDVGVTGTVRGIATSSTGHRGNVFHIAPLQAQPGKFLTCGADGYLRLVDMVAEHSSVVVHPSMDDEMEVDSPFVYHTGMAYSHVFLSPNTGLLCSERGLHHFDLRLTPREQQRRSILKDQVDDEVAWRSSACKACAPWNPHVSIQGEEAGSHYVFAGGASETVGLYDLRMDGSKNRIVQRYKPKELTAGGGSVSVSGLDVSKDGRELLVSYESDQIYSFPILQDSVCPAGPTLECIDQSSMHFECSSDHSVAELASYGGHLNRFTFLKNAKYAGPKDDYVCTGSDSGHAWIFERKTGTVVSLLGADRSTCNGVIPHPSLPFFITYGIEVTAKLWRASPPTDPGADDSPPGRLSCSLQQPFEMSPVTKSWDGVQRLLRPFTSSLGVLPDYIASGDEIAASGRFCSPCRAGISGPDTPRIGNALLRLPSLLRQNHHECYQAFDQELDVPVEHPLIDFTHRTSLSRLRFQADKLGLPWNPWKPWAIGAGSCRSDIHPADLVPDFPSDWINFDLNLIRHPLAPRRQFQLDHKDLLGYMIPGFFEGKGGQENGIPWLPDQMDDVKHTSDALDDSSPDPYESNSRRILCQTALLLKDGGNEAVKQGRPHAAARRYDKAIQYCAVAVMRYSEGNSTLKHLSDAHFKRVESEECSQSYHLWSEPLRILIMCRLNLALLLIRPEFAQPERAAAQARSALKLLAPFTVKEGKIISIREKKHTVLEKSEPIETFKEAQGLQAKAYFRLGSAEMEMNDYASAVKSYEMSLKSSLAVPSAKPDSLTTLKLQEAKRKRNSKKKRHRAKFQRMFRGESTTEEEEKDTGSNKSAVVTPGP